MKKSYKSGPRNGGTPQGAATETPQVENGQLFNSFSLDNLIVHQELEEDKNLQETEVENESEEDEERPMSEAARLRAEAILTRKSTSRSSSKRR